MIILKVQVPHRCPHTTRSYTKHSHTKKTSTERKTAKDAKYTSIKQQKAILALSCLIIYILFHPLKKHKANQRFWDSKYRKFSVAILLYSGESRPSDKGGAPSHPDPEIRGGGGLQKNFFGPSGAASVWSKNRRGAWASQAPPLDLPLLYTKRSPWLLIQSGPLTIALLQFPKMSFA